MDNALSEKKLHPCMCVEYNISRSKPRTSGKENKLPHDYTVPSLQLLIITHTTDRTVHSDRPVN